VSRSGHVICERLARGSATAIMTAMPITATVPRWLSLREHHETADHSGPPPLAKNKHPRDSIFGRAAVGRRSSPSAERDDAMRAHNTNRHAHARMESVFAGAHSKASGPRSMRLIHSSTDPYRTFGRRTQEPPMLENEIAEIQTEIDGLPIVVRLVLRDGRAENRSVRDLADIQSWLSGTLEKIVERMRGSPIRGDESSGTPLAVVELTSSGARLLQVPTEPVLRVGTLELHLSERTAKRSDRAIG